MKILNQHFLKNMIFFQLLYQEPFLNSLFLEYALLKKYYYKLDGDGELNEFLIYVLPYIGLFIGAGLSFFNWFKRNETILIKEL